MLEMVTPDRDTQFGRGYRLSPTTAFKEIVTNYGTKPFVLVGFQRVEQTII